MVYVRVNFSDEDRKGYDDLIASKTISIPFNDLVRSAYFQKIDDLTLSRAARVVSPLPPRYSSSNIKRRAGGARG